MCWRLTAESWGVWTEGYTGLRTQRWVTESLRSTMHQTSCHHLFPLFLICCLSRPVSRPDPQRARDKRWIFPWETRTKKVSRYAMAVSNKSNHILLTNKSIDPTHFGVATEEGICWCWYTGVCVLGWVCPNRSRLRSSISQTGLDNLEQGHNLNYLCVHTMIYDWLI